MSEFPLLAQLLIIPRRLAYRTGHTDRAYHVADDRHAFSLFSQQSDRIESDFRPSAVQIHRRQLFVVLNSVYGIACDMRFKVLSAHGARCAHCLRLNSHAERHAVVFKAVVVVYGLCKVCHHARISMSLRQIHSAYILQSLCDHVHHSARAYAGRPVGLHT